MNFVLDPLDFQRFAPVALKNSTKKGVLEEVRRGSEKFPAFYCLFGNLLFTFENDNDANSLSGLIFLESSKCKIVNSVFPLLAITTVGGRTINLTSSQPSELQEWMDAIENHKFIQLTRKVDDIESTLLQLQHASEQQTHVQIEYDKTIMDCRQQIEELQRANEQLQATIEQLLSDKADLNRTLKQSETERLLLLKSRGITPKSMPQWALQEAPRKGVSEPLKRLRIWTGTWNVSGKEPFSGMEKERAKRLLQPFVPAGYDIYALSVQDCVSESIFECFDALQASEGCRRLRLMTAAGTPMTNDDGSDPSRLYGRGDGTLKSLKFTGLVIYVRAPLVGDVKMLNMINFPLSSTHSRGAVAAVVNALGRNVVFVSTQLDPKNNDTRRDQYQTLFTALGSNLAEADFHLNDQFHHVVWMGDFGYTLVDTSGNRMPPESATHMLSDGRLLRTLFETHDQLNQDKRNQLVFFGYREPIPYPNFYPTYKKVENRPPANYTSNDWVRNVYVTRVKDPFYYGGKVREWTPSFPDRILYYSMTDLAEDLIPESVPAEMSIHLAESSSNSGGGGNGTRDSITSPSTTAISSTSGAEMVVQVDNYRSINDGEAMNVSEHSPVFATYVLRLRHDFSELLASTPARTASGGVLSMTTANGTSTAGGGAGGTGSSRAGGANAGAKTVQSLLTVLANHENSLDGTSNRPMGFDAPPEPVRLADAFPASPEAPPSAPLTGAPPAHHHHNSSSNPVVGIPATPLRQSLLPHGIYRIRLSDMRMIWGVNEESPRHVGLLFPAPYEAIAGERFVEFQSEMPATTLTFEELAAQQDLHRGVASSMYSPSKSPRGGAASAAPSSSKSLRNSYRSPAKGNPAMDSLLAAASLGWRKTGTSNTGTCVRLESAAISPSGGIATAAGAKTIPPVILTWRGDEPLDRLHICIKVSGAGGGSFTALARSMTGSVSVSVYTIGEYDLEGDLGAIVE